MERKHLRILSLAVLGLLAGGCSDGTLAPDDPDPAEDSTLTQQIADAVVTTEALAAVLLDEELEGTAPATGEGGGGGTLVVDRTFSRSVDCPLGGQVLVEGSMHDFFEFATLTRETSVEGAKTISACALRQDGFVLTLDGSAQWEAFRRRVAGRADGLQTASYTGSITAVREDGKSRSCEIAIQAVRDPEAHTATLTVSICGHEFTKTVTWTPRGGGD
jgi:hypothetical protein